MTQPEKVDAAYRHAASMNLNAGELVELSHRLINRARSMPIVSTEFRSAVLAADVINRVDESLGTLVTVSR